MLRRSLVPALLFVMCATALGQERRVVMIATENPKLPVKVGDFIRISDKINSGGEITAKIEGPGSLVNTNTADKVKEGRFWVGVVGKEFEIHAQAEGKIVVTVTLDSKREKEAVKTKVYTINVLNNPFPRLKGKDRNVIVVTDNKQPAKAKPFDIIRVTAARQSGPGETTVKVEGKGRLINTNSLTEINDRGPLVGAHVSEFEVLATGKGELKITCTIFIERLKSTKSTTYTVNVE
jgi:predicted secreted protein